jgi:hypothetical protein
MKMQTLLMIVSSAVEFEKPMAKSQQRYVMSLSL